MKLYRITWKFIINDFHVETQFRARNKRNARYIFTQFMKPVLGEIVLVEEVK